MTEVYPNKHGWCANCGVKMSRPKARYCYKAECREVARTANRPKNYGKGKWKGRKRKR